MYAEIRSHHKGKSGISAEPQHITLHIYLSCVGANMAPLLFIFGEIYVFIVPVL